MRSDDPTQPVSGTRPTSFEQRARTWTKVLRRRLWRPWTAAKALSRLGGYALDVGERDHAITMPPRVAVGVGVRLAALEEEMQIVLPGEADSAVNLER
jgi:hypothetical protein